MCVIIAFVAKYYLTRQHLLLIPKRTSLFLFGNNLRTFFSLNLNPTEKTWQTFATSPSHSILRCVHLFEPIFEFRTLTLELISFELFSLHPPRMNSEWQRCSYFLWLKFFGFISSKKTRTKRNETRI